MLGKLVYKTDDGYINLYESPLECIDYSCHVQLKNEENLRDVFSDEINDIDGEFKILINPQDLDLHEWTYHKNMLDINHLQEINVRYDCCEKEEFIKKIADMMNNSDLVLDGLFERFKDNLDKEQKSKYLYGKNINNKNYKLNALGYFLEDKFDDRNSYLFVRELEEYCRKIYNMELDIKKRWEYVQNIELEMSNKHRGK